MAKTINQGSWTIQTLKDHDASILWIQLKQAITDCYLVSNSYW